MVLTCTFDRLPMTGTGVVWPMLHPSHRNTKITQKSKNHPHISTFSPPIPKAQQNRHLYHPQNTLPCPQNAPQVTWTKNDKKQTCSSHFSVISISPLLDHKIFAEIERGTTLYIPRRFYKWNEGEMTKIEPKLSHFCLFCIFQYLHPQTTNPHEIFAGIEHVETLYIPRRFHKWNKRKETEKKTSKTSPAHPCTSTMGPTHCETRRVVKNHPKGCNGIIPMENIAFRDSCIYYF